MERLSTMWKSDLFDNLKREFFQAVAISMLLYRGSLHGVVAKVLD